MPSGGIEHSCLAAKCPDGDSRSLIRLLTGRDAHDDSARRNVSRDHRRGAYDGCLADLDAGEDLRSGADLTASP